MADPMEAALAEEARELLLTMAQRKAQMEAMASTQGQDQERLLTILSSFEQKTLAATGSDGRKVKGTVIAAERIVIDADRLKNEIGAKLWDKVSVRTLDKGLLEAHVKTKAVDENVVAACTEIKTNKPYVKISGDLLPTVAAGAVVTASSSGREKAAVKRVKAKRAAAAGPVMG